MQGVETFEIAVNSESIDVVKFNPKKFNSMKDPLLFNPLRLFREPCEVKLFFILEEKINECRGDNMKILKTIDAFMRTFLGSLFMTRYEKNSTALPLLTSFESKIWKKIIDHVRELRNVTLCIPDVNSLLQRLKGKNLNEQKKYYRENIQAKKLIVSPEKVSRLALLQCQNDKICYLSAFPSNTDIRECEFCLKLIYMLACKNCQELNNG